MAVTVVAQFDTPLGQMKLHAPEAGGWWRIREAYVVGDPAELLETGDEALARDVFARLVVANVAEARGAARDRGQFLPRVHPLDPASIR